MSAIGRVLWVLTAWLADGPLLVCNRDLATAAGCKSASVIPRILRTLEADGHITRTTSPHGSVIALAGDRTSDRSDRSFDQAIEPSIAAPPDADPAAVTNPPDAADRTSDRSDRSFDPPHTPHNGISSYKQQQQQLRAALEKDLTAAGAYPGPARKLAACYVGHADRTAEAFRAEIDLATRDGREKPIGYVTSLWMAGDHYTPKQETDDARPIQPPAAQDRPRRRVLRDADPSPARVDPGRAEAERILAKYAHLRPTGALS